MHVSFRPRRSGTVADSDALIRDHSFPVSDASDLDPLLEHIGHARYVLLGEASHGTHEYYVWRARLSKRLIEEKGFSFIAVEGDWPDCYRVNRYVKGYPDSGLSALQVLHAFNRWPTWMWANWEIVAFAEWLRNLNERRTSERKVGFYGLDVYSLWESFDAVIRYLDKRDPGTKRAAVEALQCFEPYGDGEGREYARASLLVPKLCEEEVIGLLMQIRRNMPVYNTDHEAVLSAEQNAHVIVNAERYYRAMVRPGNNAWNIRDHHMVQTLNRLMRFHGPGAKAIIWEHNTHVGDARATDMADSGLVNVGQLVRESHAQDDVYIVGLGAYRGSVVAGRQWGDVMRVLPMPEAMPGSWEHRLHMSDVQDRVILMSEAVKEALGDTRFGHRAIGVVYHPRYEKPGNYVPSIIPQRYDAFMYFDQAHALHPLHIHPDGHQVPETYPFGV